MKCCNNCIDEKCADMMHGIPPDRETIVKIFPENWDCEKDYCSHWKPKETEETIEDIFNKMDKDLETLNKVFKDFGETLTKFAKETKDNE